MHMLGIICKSPVHSLELSHMGFSCLVVDILCLCAPAKMPAGVQSACHTLGSFQAFWGVCKQSRAQQVLSKEREARIMHVG